MPLVIRELLTIEVWKEKLFSRKEVVKALAKNSGTKAYFILYHEAVLVSILEKALFHASAVAACK